MMEEELDVVLRKIEAARQEISNLIAHGGVSADNVQGGYRDMSGRIRGLDEAEGIIREAFKGWLPQAPPGVAPAKRFMGEY
jgi:hypothetical protein